MPGALVLIIVGLIFLATLSFSAAAFGGSSRRLMQKLAYEGDRRARYTQRLFDKRQRVLYALLLVQTTFSLCLAVRIAFFIVSVTPSVHLAFAAISASIMMIAVFCIMAPRALALRFPNRALREVLPLILVVDFFLGPLVHVGGTVFRIFSPLGSTAKDGENDSRDIRGAANDIFSFEQQSQQRKMARSILDLNEVEVGEVMVHRSSVATINGELPISELFAEVTNSPFTRFPVWLNDPDNIVGILHCKALLRAIRDKGVKADTIDVMSLVIPPWFISGNTTLLTQLQAFRKRREHVALVVDEYGSLRGLVTLEDLIEEVVGDLSDEDISQDTPPGSPSDGLWASPAL